MKISNRSAIKTYRINSALRTLCLFAAAGLAFLSPLRSDDKAASLITSGGGEIEMGKSVPGIIKLNSDFSFPLLYGSNGERIVSAGGTAGNGRVIAFSHGSFLKRGEVTNQKSASTLVLNAMRWTGRNSKPTVGLHPSTAELADWLAEAGIAVKILEPEDVEGKVVDTYCVIGHDRRLVGDNIAFLKEFVSRGGGLVVSTTPWAFHNKYPEFADSFPGNQLIKPAGIEFLPNGYAPTRTALLVTRSNPIELRTQQGTMIAEGKTSRDSKQPVVLAARKLAAEHRSLPDAEKNRLIAELEKAKQLRGKDLGAFVAALQDLNQAAGPVVPTKENPVVPGRDPLIDAIIDLETHFNLTLPAGAMYPIPAAADYPGRAEPAAKREIRELSIDGKYKGWLRGRNAGGWAAKELRPTGIYAAPGEVIKVTVPARIAGEGFEAVIGSYNGGLKNRDKWYRYPRLMRTQKIIHRVTEISNALGGLVNIRVPREADYEKLDVTVEGGIPAPLYVHGQTSLNDWKSAIRKHPGPWAELASERIIIALPSEYIRNLSDPDKVMELWNEIIDTAAVLVSVDRNDYRAERIVFDRQTAAGSMHSSYPVAAHIGKAAEKAVDARLLRKEGDWGFFHEYGHNHQHSLWSLPGTGETTCNLWSVYIYEELIGTNRGETHRAIRPLSRRQRVNAYFQNGRKFESEWNVWTALETYLMIQEKFGWEPYQRVFDVYNNLEEREWPRTQQEKNDQWVVRLSRACGANLYPFWKAWNLPLSPSVEKALKDLPPWDDHPVAKLVEGAR